MTVQKTDTPLRPENFFKLVEGRIHNIQLRRNLKRATSTSLLKRSEVVADFENWEEMRTEAYEIKKQVIDHLSDYLEEFENNATKNGITVHYAVDAVEARNLVLDICERCHAKTVVKAKSMVSEEIDLRHALEKIGIETIETDLGEYIVQLANEIPSHITAPALHKSREEIGELFSEQLHIPFTSEPEKLTQVARNVLRKKFLDAEVGISGVNFAVAKTGSICIVENEGNARLSTTMPRVHIALMGIEKLLPDLNALSLFLKLLARSATGQRMTSYTSLINGPRRETEPDGPDEMHVVIIDNGRTRMLSAEKLREALYCIRCGACMNVCPVYQKIGGHSYGSIYSGPIGSVLTPIFNGIDKAKHLPYASSLCGACSEICPVKIDIHHMLLWLRKRVVERKGSKLFERVIFRCWMLAMRSKPLYEFSSKLLRWFSPIMVTKNESMRIPVWSKTRDFPPLASQSFREMWFRNKTNK